MGKVNTSISKIVHHGEGVKHELLLCRAKYRGVNIVARLRRTLLFETSNERGAQGEAHH